MTTILIGRPGGRTVARARSAPRIRQALAMLVATLAQARMAAVRRDILARVDGGMLARAGLDRAVLQCRLDTPLWLGARMPRQMFD